MIEHPMPGDEPSHQLWGELMAQIARPTRAQSMRTVSYETEIDRAINAAHDAGYVVTGKCPACHCLVPLNVSLRLVWHLRRVPPLTPFVRDLWRDRAYCVGTAGAPITVRIPLPAVGEGV